MAKAPLGSQEFYRRKHAIIEKVLNVVQLMENKRGLNLKYYRDLFASMPDDNGGSGDKAFDRWASQMGHELDDTITLCHLPFEEIDLKQIQNAAKYLGLPLEQYILYKHTGKPVRSMAKVPVGYCNIKRLQQVLSKKQRLTLDSSKKPNIKTGQHSRSAENRIGDVSDDETISLLAYDSTAMLKELLGPRADNNVARAEMLNKIHQDGFVQLSDLSDEISDKTALNTFNVYLLASGIRSDLVDDDIKLPYTKRIEAEMLNIKMKK